MFWLNNRFAFPPSKLHVLITTKCNLKCSFCYCKENLNKTEPGQLTPLEWNLISKKIAKNTAVIFTGGEPFLYQYIYDALKILLDRKRMVSITTNGVGINLPKLLELNSPSLFVIMFSIHGTREIHDKITGVPGTYDRVVAMIKQIDKFKKEKNRRYPILSVKTVLCNENIENMKNHLIECEESLPVEHVYFNLMADNTLHHSLELYNELEYKKLQEWQEYEYKEETKRGILELIKFIRNITFKMDVGFTDEFKNDAELIQYITKPRNFSVKKCYRPWHELLIYGNGDFGNCLGFVAGNLKDHQYNVNKLLNVPRYKSFLLHFKKAGQIYNACNGCKEAKFGLKNER
jgi:MoaA/NifB/PqqE/SkfB family radical SAM enzyme